MRLLKILLLVAVITAVLQTEAIGTFFRNGFQAAHATSAISAAELRTTKDRLCPFVTDGALAHQQGNRRTRAALLTVTEVTAREVNDPTAATLLSAVPDALAPRDTPRRKAARALIRYSCAR